MSSRPFGFNVIGYLSGNLGLGVSARHVTALLLEKGYPVATLDLDPLSGRARHDLSLDAYAVKSPSDLPYGVNFSILGIPSLPSFFLRPPAVVGCKATLRPGSDYWLGGDRLNVALVWWELTVMPELWVRALELFDVVVAASPFIRATLETHLSNVLTIPAIHPFSLPDGITESRARFGLPKDVVLFVSSFEPRSDPERKNPFAAIAAFKLAFANDSRANLIIKLNNATGAGPILAPILAKLKHQCDHDPRIRIIDETLTYADVLALYASCDVFVSLHRSEGLGLGLMEAMALGKPVIATAWAGNMAFMNHTNSCLVRYKLIPVEATLQLYSKHRLASSAMWADPNLDEAAAWMAKLVDDPEMRASLGRRAAMSIVDLQQEARKAKWVDELRTISQNDAFLSGGNGRKRLDALEKVRLAERRQKESTLPYGKRLHKQLRRSVDRHLLWRFR